jgi:hypothetical protein
MPSTYTSTNEPVVSSTAGRTPTPLTATRISARLTQPLTTNRLRRGIPPATLRTRTRRERAVPAECRAELGRAGEVCIHCAEREQERGDRGQDADLAANADRQQLLPVAPRSSRSPGPALSTLAAATPK